MVVRPREVGRLGGWGVDFLMGPEFQFCKTKSSELDEVLVAQQRDSP